MALLGQGFRPELGVYDYSAITRANEMMGQATANLGQQVGDGIADYSKEQKNLKAEVAKGKSALAFAKTYHPELADQIDALGQVFNDPSKSLNEQAAVGSQIGDHVSMILGEKRYQQEMGMKRQELTMKGQEQSDRHNLIGAQIAGMNAKEADKWDVLTVPNGDGTQMIERNVRTGETRMMREPTQDQGLVPFVANLEGFNSKAYSDSGQTSIGYGTVAKPGETEISHDDAAIRLQTELQASADRIDKALSEAKVAFNPNERNALISFDYNTGQGQSVISRFGNDKAALVSKMAEYVKDNAGDANPLPGLVNRRKAEIGLFQTPVGAAGQPTAQASQGTTDYIASGAQPRQTTAPFGYKPNITPEMMLKAKEESDARALQMKQAELGIAKTQQEMAATTTAQTTAATEKTKIAEIAVAKGERFTQMLDDLEKSPGFGKLFGSNLPLVDGVTFPGSTHIAGTDGANSRVKLETIDAQGFMVAIQDMKGMGSLSNAEGLKASIAFTGLKESMSEDDAKAQIKELKSTLQLGIQRQKSGQLVNPDGTPKVVSTRFDRANTLKTLGQ